MSQEVAKVKRENIAACMTCPICDKFFSDATTITECLHTFCRKCIYKKLSDEEMKCCPLCNIDLGPYPLDKLRPDRNVQAVCGNIFPKRKNQKPPTVDVLAPSPVPPSGEGSSEHKALDYLVEAAHQILPPHVTQSCVTTLAEKTDQILQTSGAKALVAASEEKPNNMPQVYGTQTSNATSSHANNCDIWFKLVASDEKEAGGPPLPQVSTGYMRIKDGRATVSHIQKLLKSKLGLNSENEVDVLCMGQRVPPSLSLSNLLAQWLRSSGRKRITTRVGKSAEPCMMTLGYARRVTCD